MIRHIVLGSFLFFFLQSHAQENGFPFGKVTYRELEMASYEKDTSASAVVLNEFGEAYIDNGGDNNLIFEYHVKIKIFKKDGLKYADIEIPLWKQEGRSEKLLSVKASSFSIEKGTMKETTFSDRDVFTENRGKFVDFKKFAIPNVREGSVIEFQYKIESPFIYNFRNWEFQDDLPKVNSEYWTLIPGNYVYNITLRGHLALTKNESELVRDCFTPGGGYKADCVLSKYGMKNIPAFIEEDYMTARSNFICAINFELSEVKYFDGRVDKKTKEWKDVEEEMRRHQEFGLQLKRGKDIVDDHIDLVTIGEVDPLIKAKKIYDFIKNWYTWDGNYSKYSELGIKKAFDQKKGNVGDINLSLIAAMRYAGLDAEPVILSTRANGLPIEVHPVISNFNYVIAKVNIGDKVYLADATDDFHPFGLLPERCLNGRGRVLGDKQSYWIDLKTSEKEKHISLLNLKLESDGYIRGDIQTTYLGYAAASIRRKIYSFQTQKEYIQDLDEKFENMEIKNYDFKNLDELDKPFIQKLEVEILALDNVNAQNFLFNPFIFGKWDKNPFTASERSYPVDFGTPMEFITILNLQYPQAFEIVNKPDKTALGLPNGGGRFICEAIDQNSKLSINNSLIISRPLFTSVEYHYLKELFARIIQVQNGDLIFKKKP